MSSLNRLIVTTIEETLRFPNHGGGNVGAPYPYDKFCELLRDLREKLDPPRTVAIITFNYDCGLDYALDEIGKQPLYGLTDASDAEGIPLLKLHGSLNWALPIDAEDAEKRGIMPWRIQHYRQTKDWARHVQTGETCRLRIGSGLKEASVHFGFEVRGEPVIVPPTWNKSEAHTSLSKVWKRAAEELSDARDIFVVGYSLPKTDAFFTYLYALGTVPSGPLNRFWVFNPDESGQVKERFESMLGPGAEARFDYIEQRFFDAIDTIRSAFKVG